MENYEGFETFESVGCDQEDRGFSTVRRGFPQKSGTYPHYRARYVGRAYQVFE